MHSDASLYAELLAYEEDEPGLYAKIEIADGPYRISSKDNMYLVYDNIGFCYVVRLVEKDAKKIYNLSKGKTYTVYGKLYPVQNQVRDALIKSYNKESTSNKITEENYHEYFGSTYLDVSQNKSYTTGILIIVFAGGVLIFLLIRVIRYSINTTKTLISVGEDELEGALQAGHWFDKEEIVLTSQLFVFNTVAGLKAFNYHEIGWTYVMGSRNTSTKELLIIYLKNGKIYKTKEITNSGEKVYEHLLADLANRAPEILIGYNYENLQAYKQMKNLI